MVIFRLIIVLFVFVRAKVKIILGDFVETVE